VRDFVDGARHPGLRTVPAAHRPAGTDAPHRHDGPATGRSLRVALLLDEHAPARDAEPTEEDLDAETVIAP